MKPTRLAAALASLCLMQFCAPARADIQSTDYPSIQAAIDANPGRMIYIPNGDHHVSDMINITKDGTGLFGPGRIIQDNPDKPIINVGADNVRIRDLTLTRPADKCQTDYNGIQSDNTTGLIVENVSVIDNRGPGGSIKLEDCIRPTIRNCTILNYRGLAIDDRTQSPEYGYAFTCVDGTGMKVFYCSGAQVIGNRIVDEVFPATKENRDKYDLGKVTIMPKARGELTPQEIYDTGHTNNWNQGSGLIVGGLGNSQYSQIIGNYIENAAQGMDIHADYVIVSNNIVNGGMMGMKAMHGSKHVIISNNQFSRVVTHGILLRPGAASHDAMPTSGTTPAKGPNIDGGSIVMGNVISDFGFGHDYWLRYDPAPHGDSLNGITLGGEQMPDDPPLRDVIVTDNVVYDTGRDKMIVDGEPKVVEPRFRHALYVEREKKHNPENILIRDNLLHRGRTGVSNIELPE